MIAQDPSLALAFHQRALAHQGSRNYRQALKDFDKALGLARAATADERAARPVMGCGTQLDVIRLGSGASKGVGSACAIVDSLAP